MFTSSDKKKVGPTVEEVQYRESSRGLVSHGLFVAREVVAENKRQRRSSKRSTYIAELLRLGSLTIKKLLVSLLKLNNISKFNLKLWFFLKVS